MPKKTTILILSILFSLTFAAADNNCDFYSCLTPDEFGDITQEDIFLKSNSYDLQDVLDNYGFDLNVKEDQTNQQVWYIDSDEIIIEIELVGKGEAGNSNVFGYYLNGDISSFEPLFQIGSNSNYDVPIFVSRQKITISIPGKNDISFGIDSENQAKTKSNLFLTQNHLNPDLEDHVIVYDLCDNEYILAFEDLLYKESDLDFEDLVVLIRVEKCFEYREGSSGSDEFVTHVWERDDGSDNYPEDFPDEMINISPEPIPEFSTYGIIFALIIAAIGAVWIIRKRKKQDIY